MRWLLFLPVLSPASMYSFQMKMVYRDILAKQQEEDKLAQEGKRKYEYDSDEDTEVSKSHDL